MTSPKSENYFLEILFGAAFLVASFFCINFALAFGNRCAKVHTAPLNERATDASALPTTTLQVASGAPIRIMKMNTENIIQLATAAVLSIGGLVMLFCGVYIAPLGQIHESLLIGFGEVATFAGAIFGVDYTYKKRQK